jgi:hypothetical protein
LGECGLKARQVADLPGADEQCNRRFTDRPGADGEACRV